jgi:hypothetical protein
MFTSAADPKNYQTPIFILIHLLPRGFLVECFDDWDAAHG